MNPKIVPKVVGSDIEYGNLVERDHISAEGSGWEAARLLLKHIPGVPASRALSSYTYSGYGGYGYGFGHQQSARTGYDSVSRGSADYDYEYGSRAAGPQTTSGGYAGSSAYDPLDVGRKFLPNGMSFYIDSGHLEHATAECASATDWAANFYAGLLMIREAQHRAAAEVGSGEVLRVFLGNSDGLGNSWGAHMNILMTRRAWFNLFERRLQYLMFLAGYQVSSCVTLGLGKVGSDRNQEFTGYQLSQRCDFFSRMVSLDTMHHRGILNTRNESLCGQSGSSALARLHHISADACLMPCANVLKAGALQIVTAMIEAESELITPSLLLDSPVEAWRLFSSDPELGAEARLVGGEPITALALQRRFLDAAARFVDSGACEDIVPRADEILGIWARTLDLLEARDWDACSRRIDWVLKKRIIEGALGEGGDDIWASPDAKFLDLMYGNVVSDQSPFWDCVSAGVIDDAVDSQRAQHFMTAPPEDTRAWTRGHIIAGRGDYTIDGVDWSYVRIRLGRANGYGRIVTVPVDIPYESTQHDYPWLAKPGGIERLLRELSLTSENAIPAAKEIIPWKPY